MFTRPTLGLSNSLDEFHRVDRLPSPHTWVLTSGTQEMQRRTGEERDTESGWQTSYPSYSGHTVRRSPYPLDLF